jgi:hypothetical protein
MTETTGEVFGMKSTPKNQVVSEGSSMVETIWEGKRAGRVQSVPETTD